MAKYALVIDYKFCFGCHVCDVACVKEHDFAEGDYGMTVSEQGPFKFSGGWEWNYIPAPTNLCDLCKDRLAEGKDPTCVHHCLSKCIELVPLEDVQARLAELDYAAAAFVVKQ